MTYDAKYIKLPPCHGGRVSKSLPTHQAKREPAAAPEHSDAQELQRKNMGRQEAAPDKCQRDAAEGRVTPRTADTILPLPALNHANTAVMCAPSRPL